MKKIRGRVAVIIMIVMLLPLHIYTEEIIKVTVNDAGHAPGLKEISDTIKSGEN